MVALAGGEQVAKPALSFLETNFQKENPEMRHSKKLAALAITAGVAITATAAFAYWTSTGSGVGGATTGTDVAWDVNSVNVDAANELTPGGPSNTIDFTVENDNTGHQYLDKVVVSVAKSDGSAWSSGSCGADDFAIGTAAAGDSFVIEIGEDLAGAASHAGSFELQMVNLSANQNDCRNVAVPLYLAAS